RRWIRYVANRGSILVCGPAARNGTRAVGTAGTPGAEVRVRSSFVLRARRRSASEQVFGSRQWPGWRDFLAPSAHGRGASPPEVYHLGGTEYHDALEPPDIPKDLLRSGNVTG